MNPIAKLVSLVALAALSIGAGNPHPDWNSVVTLSADGSHVLGNPDAKLKLTEYGSYTCPHCAAFWKESEGYLRMAYVHPGKLSFEFRHLIRDPIDLTVAMLTNCGPKDKFFLNNAAFMSRQAEWIEPLAHSTEAQRARWQIGDLGQRNRAIAEDFGFYKIMATRGYERPQIDRCLSDKAMAEQIAKQTQKASADGVDATPTFAINGTILLATYDWATLKPQLDARL